jgi:hypothetical protein
MLPAIKLNEVSVGAAANKIMRLRIKFYFFPKASTNFPRLKPPEIQA